MKNVEDFWDKKDRTEGIVKAITYVCVCVFGLIFCGYMLNLYLNSHNYVFLRFKINPEFTLVVNGNDKVIYYIPLNEDASRLYKLESFKDMTSEEAVNKVIEIAKENNIIIEEEEKSVVVTVISNKKEEIDVYEKKVVESLKKVDSNIVASVQEATEEEIKTYSQITSDNFNVAQDIITSVDDSAPIKEKGELVHSKNMSGLDRYLTAVNVSKSMYQKSDSVVIINGTDLINGYLSNSLASTLNAPILLVEKDKILDDVIDELKRLSVKNIYVLGSSSLVSDSVVNKIETLTGGVVERIYGENRYTTAINIANKVNLIKSINSIILAPSSDDLIDAALIGSVSGKENMPILYSSTDSLNSDVKKFLNTNSNISKIYISGGKFSNSVISDLKKNYTNISVEVLIGQDRYETNSLIISKFYKNFDSIILVNNFVDIIVASQLSVYKNAPLMLSSGLLSESQVNLLSSSVDAVYYFGGDDVRSAYRNLVYEIKKVKSRGNVKDLLFTNSKAVFYVPHQDDETSYYSQTITTAIDVLGSENVFVVVMSDGAASAVLKDDNAVEILKSRNLTITEARDLEYKSALKELGVKNIQFVEELGVVDVRFKDKGLSKSIDKVKEVMKWYDNKYSGDITHFTYTFLDEHTDHNTLGKALSELYFESDVDESKDNKYSGFTDVYLIVKMTESHNIPSRYSLTLNDLSLENKNKILNAFKKYGYYYETNECKVTDELVGIGCISAEHVFEAFDEKLSNNNLSTLIHVPYSN